MHSVLYIYVAFLVMLCMIHLQGECALYTASLSHVAFLARLCMILLRALCKLHLCLYPIFSS